MSGMARAARDATGATERRTGGRASGRKVLDFMIR